MYMGKFSTSTDISASDEERSTHLALTADLVRKELWAVQLHHYPKSVQLSVKDVLDWAGKDVRRLRSIALALQNDASVWYFIPGIGGPASTLTGCRYGWEGHEYMSGFSDL